jgi:hypothetical protein
VTRRHEASDETDRGAVLIWVALMMVVLLGVGALVIDIGALYAERRELQNGADAAALAVAQDCVAGNCLPKGVSRAKDYANYNAKDGVSAVDRQTPCGQHPSLPKGGCKGYAPNGVAGASGWVRVRTLTETASRGDKIPFVFAPIIGSLTGKGVSAAAVAAWGPMRTATTFPFTFSECEFDLLPKVGNPPFPTDVETFIYSKMPVGKKNDEPRPCAGRTPSGGTVEGCFGWLDTAKGSCDVTLTAGEEIVGIGDPGNDNLLSKSPCKETDVRNQEVLVPLFSSVQDSGNNAAYTFSGFAGFIITGYALSNSTWPSGFSCPVVTGGSARCFRGKFIRTYKGVGDFAGGAARDFGAQVIKMVD